MGRGAHKDTLTSLEFGLPEWIHTEALGVLFPRTEETDGPWERGLVGVLHPAVGATRRTLLMSEIVPQEPGWVTEEEEGLMFSPRYFSRALDRVSELGLNSGLLVVHSHPHDAGDARIPPIPSRWDLRGELTLLHSLAQALPSGAPVAAGIMGPSGSWRIREYSFEAPEDETQMRRSPPDTPYAFADAQATRVVGSSGLIVREPPRMPARSDKALRRADSTIRLWGGEAQEILVARTFGIAGCGGLGSLLAEHLSKIGVGRLILVDYDLVEEENLNRMSGVTADDVGKPKVECVARHCREVGIAPGFEVIPIRASASEEEGLRPLLDADVLLAAADPPHVRQVLDHAAYAHLIPVLDGGTIVDPGIRKRETDGKCQITDAGPGRPCLECSGAYTRNEVTEWLEKPEFRGRNRYVLRRPELESESEERAPSILSLNALVASQSSLRALDKVLGFLPFRDENQQRYYVGEGKLDWGPAKRCVEACTKPSKVARGDNHTIPVAIDPTWAALRAQEAKTAVTRR